MSPQSRGSEPAAAASGERDIAAVDLSTGTALVFGNAMETWFEDDDPARIRPVRFAFLWV